MTAFLTVDEVAARWKVSRSKVYELTATGRIPMFTPPSHAGATRGGVRIPLDELEAYEKGDVTELEEVHLPHGGRRVRPVSRSRRAYKQNL